MSQAHNDEEKMKIFEEYLDNKREYWNTRFKAPSIKKLLPSKEELLSSVLNHTKKENQHPIHLAKSKAEKRLQQDIELFSKQRQ